MLSKRFLRPRPCLDRLSSSPLSITLRVLDPPFRYTSRHTSIFRPAVDRRCLTSRIADGNSGLNIKDLPHDQEVSSTREHDTALNQLLRAIQRRDAGQIVPKFLSWVMCLDHANPRIEELARGELSRLAPPVLSEILRHVDPSHPLPKDPAHGLNLSAGTHQFINASSLNDNFGVRVQHVSVVKAMRTLMRVRVEMGPRLLISDYEVFIRCAGAASDFGAAAFFWGAVAVHGYASERTVKTWTEFIKARYLTEPLYYQFDRTRVLQLPRDFPKHLNMQARKEMDRIRMNINALMTKPLNRMRGRIHQDNRRHMRYRLGPLSFNDHWARAKDYGVAPDAEYMRVSMIALERSGALDLINAIALRRGFGITIDRRRRTSRRNEKGRKGIRLRGRHRIRLMKRTRNDEIHAPDAQLLNALVETFGSMSLLPLAMKTIITVSRDYKVPIPHEVWSNLLQWTYVCASKTNQRMQKIAKQHDKKLTALDVAEVWKLMTSKHFGITPSFDDYTVYVRSLLVRASFRQAIDLLRDKMVPHYEKLAEEHKEAVFDDVLQAEVSEGGSSPSHRRIQLETQKEYAWYQIASCFDRLVHVACKMKRRREGIFMKVTLPNLIREFDDFFHQHVHYRIGSGSVRLLRPIDERRFYWREEQRTTLPMRQPGYRTNSAQIGRKYFKLPKAQEYPLVPELKIKQRQRTPIKRARAMGPAPSSWTGDDAKWWNTIERDIRL